MGQRVYKYKKDVKDSLMPSAVSLPLRDLELIEAIVKEHQLKLGPVLRQFVLRGLAAYLRDGLLEEPADTIHLNSRLMLRSQIRGEEK